MQELKYHEASLKRQLAEVQDAIQKKQQQIDRDTVEKQRLQSAFTFSDIYTYAFRDTVICGWCGEKRKENGVPCSCNDI